MLRENERNIAMICRKEMAVFQDNMWLIVSLTTVISASSLLLQTQVVLLFQIRQQHQSNLHALKDGVTARNTLGAEIFAGRNFRDFCPFSQKFLPSKIVKRKIAKVFSSENKIFS